MNADMIVLFFVIPLTGAFFALLNKILPHIKTAKPAAVISLTLCLVLLFLYSKSILAGAIFETVLGNTLSAGIAQTLDGTAWLGLVLMFTVSYLSVVFAFSEKQYDSIFYFFFMILISGMAGTILAADFFNLFVCLEITGISAYILIAYLQKDRAILASFKYLLLSSTGITLFLAGIFIIYKNTGSLYINSFNNYLSDPAMNRTETVFAVSAIIAGIGIRTAFIPFHTWLPDAHAYAPHPVSAVLSGVVIKVSFLAVWRIIVFTNLSSVQTLLLWAGALTAFYGVIRALMQNDCKVLLAWHSVSQMGIILAGFGAGTAGAVTGAMYHAINHSLFKSLLFLSIGSVIILTDKRSIKTLSGLIKTTPFLALLFFIGALSISGIPPFNGYASKKLILGSLGNNNFIYWILWISSACTAASFIKLSRIFRINNFKGISLQNRDSSFSIFHAYLAMSILAVLCILTGIFANTITETISFLVLRTNNTVQLSLWTFSSAADSLLVAAAGIVIYLLVMGKPGKAFQEASAFLNVSFEWSMTLLFTGFTAAACFVYYYYLLTGRI